MSTTVEAIQISSHIYLDKDGYFLNVTTTDASGTQTRSKRRIPSEILETAALKYLSENPNGAQIEPEQAA